MSSKYHRKRKHELEEDTSGEGTRGASPERKSNKKDKNDDAESISIEETNRIRAELGLAPLQVDSGPSAGGQEEKEASDGSKVFNEDGIEIHHKAAGNLSEDKEQRKMREKIEVHKQKEKIYGKVLKVRKGLADSDSDDDADAWLEKSRRKAEAKASQFDEMDQEAEREVEQLKKRSEKRGGARRKMQEDTSTSGLVVGHSLEAFVDGSETVLVLEDRDVLDENGEEVLVNPNLVENERHKKNVENKKKKTDYNPYDDDIDEFGMSKKQQILAKYDEGLDGEAERQTFRLDSTGNYDLDREQQEMEMKRKLMMANKRFESLESTKYKVAREFYTEEEMVSFRKPKKKKDKDKGKKRKTLKASDLAPEPEQETDMEKAEKAKRLAARRKQQEQDEDTEDGKNGMVSTFKEVTNDEVEEGEVKEETLDVEIGRPKWKSALGGAVDINKLKKLAEKEEGEESDEEESDDELFGGANITGVVLDDDAEDELQAALDRTRKLQQQREQADAAKRVREAMQRRGMIKDEPRSDAEDEMDWNLPSASGIVIDATAEAYKSIGEVANLGLAGNRDDHVDYSEIKAELESDAQRNGVQKEPSPEALSDQDMEDDELESRVLEKRFEEESRMGDFEEDEEEEEEDSNDGTDGEKPRWKSFGEEQQEAASRSSDRHKKVKKEEDEEVYGADYNNVLGEERDVTKGVGAMLRLAAEKGYLPAKKEKTSEKKMDHLHSKRYSRCDRGNDTIDEKHVRKLERMSGSGSGPVRPFQDKDDYKPNVEVTYTDKQGRLLNAKDAFRQLSWKFHGKEPGKKQIEKRNARIEKKERMKKMNSSDTPLGTLEKQRKKQEQTQSAYLILTGSQRADAAQIQKD